MSGEELRQIDGAVDELAAAGEYAKALTLLGSLVAAEPERPWAASASWFGPQLAHLVTARGVARAIAPIFKSVRYVEDSEVRAALGPWLALVQAAAGRKDAGAEELRALSGAARRLDAASDAVAWCERAVELDRKADPRNPSSLIMLGYALRDAGQPNRAVDAWKSALKLAPGHVELHLDLADLEFKRGDPAAALRWAARAVDLDGGSVKARGCLFAARARASIVDGRIDDAVALSELIGLALAHPQVPYLRSLLNRACDNALWVRLVPPPTATGEAAHPDARTPSNTGFGPSLWEYRDAEAVATVAEPSARAVDVLHEVAGSVWSEPLVAYERAVPFGELDADDLLGLLAHVPPPTAFGASLNEINGLYWNRIAQAWVCLGILHHRVHEPWQHSARRGLLLRLLHGPEDWTVDAAAFALCVHAWLRPEQRSEIAREVTARYLHAAQAVGRRVSALHEPLAAILLICPAIAPDVRAEVRVNLGLRQAAADEVGTTQKWLRQALAKTGLRQLVSED